MIKLYSVTNKKCNILKKFITLFLVWLLSDLDEIEESLTEFRQQLKDQVKNLRDIEGQPELQGFDLKPIKLEAETILRTLAH